MAQETKQATVKSTGEKIKVYKNYRTGKWINYQDCNTAYDESELQFN